MNWKLGLAALTIALAPVASAQTDNTELIKSVDAAMLDRIVEAVGDEVTNRYNKDEDPSVVARDPDTGLIYALNGTACNEGQCAGIELTANWSANSTNSDFAKLNELNLSRAAVSIALQDRDDGSKSILVSRYLILDHGQVFENLRLNTTVFVSIANALGKEFTAQ